MHLLLHTDHTHAAPVCERRARAEEREKMSLCYSVQFGPRTPVQAGEARCAFCTMSAFCCVLRGRSRSLKAAETCVRLGLIFLYREI
jgi:hypothetical protein